jgi:hypothetical protein
MTDPPTTTTILFYNAFWPSVPASLDGCPARCRLVFDPRLLPEVDVVVFHIPTVIPPIRVPKYPRQRWVGWSMESDVNYPLLSSPAFMRQFDLTMTYRRDSDIWTPYFGPRMLDRLLGPPRQKTEAAPAVYFASNCQDRSGRQEYVRELMRYLQVDSYGCCLQNRTLPVDEGRETKLDIIARYRFTLAFENSISPDYVTEKFFDPLIAGSVPVYLGAPNVDDFAPGDRCFINAARFSGPEELARYLRCLSNDPDRYDRYLEWKTQGLRPGFLAMVEALRIHPVCRLCLKCRPPAATSGADRSDVRGARGGALRPFRALLGRLNAAPGRRP